MLKHFGTIIQEHNNRFTIRICCFIIFNPCILIYTCIHHQHWMNNPNGEGMYMILPEKLSRDPVSLRRPFTMEMISFSIPAFESNCILYVALFFVLDHYHGIVYSPTVSIKSITIQVIYSSCNTLDRKIFFFKNFSSSLTQR